MTAGGRAGVSVIIPCYCATSTLDRAVHSVCEQTMLPTEILLVDDASPDSGATWDAIQSICARFEQDGPVKARAIRMPANAGPGGARNAGWEAATSDYLAFLDADDAWHPEKIAMQYPWMRKHPHIAMTGHLSAHRTGDDPWPHVDDEFPVRPCDFRDMLFRNPIKTRSVMIRRDIALRFVDGKRHSEDYLLWLQLVATGREACVIPRKLAFTFKAEFGEGGLAGDLWTMERGELDTFKRLRRSGQLGWPMFCIAGVFSLLKFVRRCLIVAAKGSSRTGVVSA